MDGGDEELLLAVCEVMRDPFMLCCDGKLFLVVIFDVKTMFLLLFSKEKKLLKYSRLSLSRLSKGTKKRST